MAHSATDKDDDEVQRADRELTAAVGLEDPRELLKKRRLGSSSHAPRGRLDPA